MVFIAQAMKYSTEDNELSFLTLAAATANVLRFLKLSVAKPAPADQLVPPTKTMRIGDDDDVSRSPLDRTSNHAGPDVERKKHPIEHAHASPEIDQSACDKPGDEKSQASGRDAAPDKAGSGELSDIRHTVKKGPGAEAPSKWPAQGGNRRHKT